jgi:exosome complex component MTR3
LPALQLHTLPKSSIDIYVLVLESESPSLESVLSAGLTVCSAAVADAGIAMNGLGVGLSSSYTVAADNGSSGSSKINPSGAEARDAEARVTVGCLPALDAVSDIWLTGEIAVENLIQVSGGTSKRSRQKLTGI